MHAKCCHSKGKKVHHFRLIFDGQRNLTLSSSEITKNGMQAASSHRVPRVANGCVSNLVTSFLEDLPGSEKLIGGCANNVKVIVRSPTAKEYNHVKF